MHPLSVLVAGPGGVVVEQDLQLAGRPGVVQQGRGELLALVPQFLEKK